MAAKNNTFIITIHDTEHATWQGSVEWVQKHEKKAFRSALELLNMLDSAVEQDGGAEDENETHL